MEIRLPDLDGLSVAQTLKQDPATRHIPIVAMTVYEVSGKQARLIGQLRVGHCQKPFSSRDAINWPRPSSSFRGSRPRDPSGHPPPGSRTDKSEQQKPTTTDGQNSAETGRPLGEPYLLACRTME